MIEIKNKIGGIGTTFTWITAFFIIAFILVIIFLPSTLYLTGKNFIFGKQGIEVGFEKGNLIETENLIAFLSIPVKIDDNLLKIKDLVLKSKEDNKYDKQLEEEMLKFISLLNQECYILRTDVVRVGKSVGIDNIPSFSGKYRNRGNQDALLNEGGVILKIFNEQDYSEIKFYSGECI